MSENEVTTFHNENAIFRIAMWSNIVAWAALVLSLVLFGNTMYSIIKNWAQVSQSLPAGFFEKIAAFGGIFLDPLVGGVFVFLALRGLSQGLYLAMDFYMGDDEGEND
ncbi:MAG: hypothetical protein ISR59_05045 [Anaerolineales bacterium]|uniref:DUF4282 domain-containing protein n=1 Tax=Candidatus Desulfolinea nitratireducens TaxID=2841698 RepID=A0A8J6NHI7_9CHLR|nr:hypothetical protein [Candidatus Desulfolinea nitratireducens]MBL6960455.1 hypothetical protein [Anaerolineales bacterium]